MGKLTFFPDEAIVTIVGIVSIAQSTSGVFEFEKFMSVPPLMARTTSNKDR